MNYAKPLTHAVLLASLTLTACTSATGEVEEHTGVAQQDALTQNALTQNALTQNALTQNALTQNALTQNALTQNALTQNGLAGDNARELFKYIVSCALPASAVIDVGAYSFDGGLGLAPEWGEPDGSCDGSCQQWVSACVISRLDYLGVERTISVRGTNPALQTSSSERKTYSVDEATYYGDIFNGPVKAYACLGPGQTQDTRVCGPSIASCGVVDVLGSCQQLCGPVRSDGSFPDCRVPATGGTCNERGTTYDGSITVFLQP